MQRASYCACLSRFVDYIMAGVRRKVVQMAVRNKKELEG